MRKRGMAGRRGSVLVGERKPPAKKRDPDRRDPEQFSMDTAMIEALQSGDLVATSSVHPGTGIKTKEKAAADKARADLTRNIAVTALSMLVPALRVGGVNAGLRTAYTQAAATGQGGGTAALSNAFKRMQPLGDDALTMLGKMDNPWVVGAVGGSYGSGMMPMAFQDMFGVRDPEEMRLAGLFGDMMTRGLGGRG